MKQPQQNQKAYFAGGCFWGVEYHLRRIPGVLDVLSGFMGGHLENPTYREVCTQNTGHIETVEVTFNPALTNFETVARRFFEIHDPTQEDRQGPDIGEQYRSVVFFVNEEQRTITLQLMEALQRQGYDIVTRMEPALRFWPADDSHQLYYDRHHREPACHVPVDRFGFKAREPVE